LRFLEVAGEYRHLHHDSGHYAGDRDHKNENGDYGKRRYRKIYDVKDPRSIRDFLDYKKAVGESERYAQKVYHYRKHGKAKDRKEFSEHYIERSGRGEKKRFERAALLFHGGDVDGGIKGAYGGEHYYDHRQDSRQERVADLRRRSDIDVIYVERIDKRFGDIKPGYVAVHELAFVISYGVYQLGPRDAGFVVGKIEF